MVDCLSSGVGVHLATVSIQPARYIKSSCCTHLPLAAGHGDVYEAAGISDSLLGAALGGLLLLLGLDLYSESYQRCPLLSAKSSESRPRHYIFHHVRNGFSRRVSGERTLGVCDLTFPARARDPWTFCRASVVVQERKSRLAGMRTPMIAV